jgi:predicted O-methyltransferase YrrM
MRRAGRMLWLTLLSFGFRHPIYSLKYFGVLKKKDLFERDSFYVEETLKIAQETFKKIHPRKIESILKSRFFSNHHFTFLYAVCRFLRPSIVLETGIGPGLSSASILQALYDNDDGKLYSIDLPDSNVGYLVPDYLKEKWTIIRGKSSEALPQLLKEVKSVDLFFHDSKHTYENMMREYQIVWPHIERKGMLVSHDVNFNNAFEVFSNQVKRTSIIINQKFKSKTGFIIR